VKQRTIAEKISCTGIGLHSGALVQMTLHPARANSGITFVRCDLSYPVEIPVNTASVVSTEYATTVGRGDVTVSTVEHLLAALYGMGIDNLRIEINAPEVPIMDGSAAPFVHLIRAAGIFEQPQRRQEFRVRRPIEVRDGEKWIRVSPSRSFSVSYSIDFEHTSIGRQKLTHLEINDKLFDRKISRARTFGFAYEVEAMRAAGLARGGSLDNAIVLDNDGVLNEEGLRFPDEFVRHKVLDLLGDLSILGMRLRGHVQVHRGGHDLHCKLLAAIVEAHREGAVMDAMELESMNSRAPGPSLA
jgi:UDP-3-O-[3-hydroxymyristoyl] N-acetylglucosamine deacetylase